MYVGFFVAFTSFRLASGLSTALFVNHSVYPIWANTFHGNRSSFSFFPTAHVVLLLLSTKQRIRFIFIFSNTKL